MKLRRLLAVARKESIHIRRDPRSLGLAVGIPMLMIVLFGWALTLDVDRVPFVLWDQSATPASRDFTARFEASRYFSLVRTVQSYDELERTIDLREAALGIVIPPAFADELGAGRFTPVEVIIDGSDANTAAIVLGYSQAITQEFNQQLRVRQLERRMGTSPDPVLDLRPRVWFNADLESKNFIIPGLTAVIMGLIAALLTSLTIAREWERGTMEQLIATPVRPVEIILGKLLPYFAIGMLDMLIAVLMAVFLFDVPLQGSAALMFALAALFIFGTLAQGILISVITRQQVLASQFAMVSTFLPAFLLSGFMFAISNMPAPVQAITYVVVPARYFVAIVKGIFLRGVGISTLWPEAALLALFAVVVTTFAVLRFRKKLT